MAATFDVTVAGTTATVVPVPKYPSDPDGPVARYEVSAGKGLVAVMERDGRGVWLLNRPGGGPNLGSAFDPLAMLVGLVSFLEENGGRLPAILTEADAAAPQP